MEKTILSVGMALLLTVVTVGGDAVLKQGTQGNGISGWKYLLAGMLIYAISAVGWFWVMKHAQLYVLGIIYSISFVVMLTAVSVFYFKEKIATVDYVAILLAVLSLLIVLRPKALV